MRACILLGRKRRESRFGTASEATGFGGGWLAALDSWKFAQNLWRELLDVPLRMARLFWFQILSAALHPSLQDSRWHW